MNKRTDIFAHTNCVSEEMLLKYVSNTLSASEKHEVEKHLIDCEMCSDAVEGLKMVGEKEKISAITSDLNSKIQSRVEGMEANIIFLQQYRTQLAAAASVIVILGLVWFFRANMSINELDSASSEKIFADKFEPYQKAEQTSPAEESLGVSKDEANQAGDANKTLQGPSSKTLTRASSGGAMNDEVVLSEMESTKENAQAIDEQPAPIAVKADDQSRDEVAVNDKDKKTPKSAAPEKSVFSGVSAATSSTAGNADSKNEYENKKREEEQLQKNRNNIEVLAMESKSKPGKNRSKAKKSNESQAVPQVMADAATANEELYSMSNKSDSVSAGLKSEGDNAPAAMQKYEQKDFSGAVEDFEKVLAKDPGNYNALFYSSVSYLSTGQPDKAITNLTKVLEKKDGEFYDAAQWYLSLAYIKKSDSNNARKYLTELKNNSKSKYQKQADETLKEMQK